MISNGDGGLRQVLKFKCPECGSFQEASSISLIDKGKRLNLLCGHHKLLREGEPFEVDVSYVGNN